MPQLLAPVFHTLRVQPEEKKRVVVCGSGPAGLFACAALVEAGLSPILLERGRDMDTRTQDVSKLKESGEETASFGRL